MKKIVTILLASFALFSFVSYNGIEEVISAFNAADASHVAKYFDNTVDITTAGKRNSYSKMQAEQVLKDFFNINPVKAFQVIHKGDNEGSQYCIGKLITKTGSFRTTLFMKQRGDKQFLQEIRIEEE
jgi:hypothetical protein